jgi:wobble nucleotide-excising tRNase
MANETVNQENTQTAEVEQKTFTQEEVNGIVAERLNRDRQKFADYEDLKKKAEEFDKLQEANKSELQKATERAAALEKELNGLKKAEEVRIIRENVAKETGIPAHLLTGTTEEECKAQATAIADYAKPAPYPAVKDAGEVNNVGKATTRQQFADWASKMI